MNIPAPVVVESSSCFVLSVSQTKQLFAQSVITRPRRWFHPLPPLPKVRMGPPPLSEGAVPVEPAQPAVAPRAIDEAETKELRRAGLAT